MPQYIQLVNGHETPPRRLIGIEYSRLPCYPPPLPNPGQSARASTLQRTQWLST